MKILLVTNKTYRGHLDGGWWYFYLPLIEMKHDVYLYDTVSPEEKDFKKVVESFRPDLIFCMLTNNRMIAPYEPWGSILEETEKGRIKTFNWFCDDTWRYDKFSRQVCHAFTACSTPEPDYIEKYKTDGYNNIILGTWHANIALYPECDFKDKDVNLSFIGAINGLRDKFFKFGARENISIEIFSNISQEEMYETHSRSKMAINLSVNENDQEMKTQMKQRMFEIPAAKAMLLTEHHPALENFFEPDKEIVTFRTYDEFVHKVKFLSSRPKLIESIAMSGFKRYLAEHESKIRLANVIEQIMAI